MELKTYVLLDSLNVSAPIYQRINKDTRVKLEKVPVDKPYLQVTFVDTDGTNKTIRYKENADSPYQDEQIKKGVLANERWTTSERKALLFNHGVLHTNKPGAQKFLEIHPQNELFKGICTSIKGAMFKEYKVGDEINNKNEDFMKRLDVGLKIKGLDLRQAQDLLIRINGSYFKVPENIKEAQNQLIAYMDETDDAGLDEILKDAKDLTADEKATVLIGNAINADLISFEAVSGQVSKRKGDKDIKLKDIPTDLNQSEKEKYFADFLTTKDGLTLFDDLQKDLEKLNSKTK